MSPQAVVTYLMGGTLESGLRVTPKYIGDRRLMEVAVATLATDRALLLLGVPGTAKMLGQRAPGGGHLRHLAATSCRARRARARRRSANGLNYALLLAKGPSREAVVASPVMRAMEEAASPASRN